MTDLELEVIKLRWHVEIMETLFMTVASSFPSASRGVSPQELSRISEQVFAHAQESVATTLNTGITSKERRDQLLKAFRQEMERIRKSLASLLEDLPQ